MTDAKPFSDEELKVFGVIDEIDNPPHKLLVDDIRRFLDTIAARDTTIQQQAATIERMRDALEPFALFTMSVTFKVKSKDRFVKAVFECKDFKTARKALDTKEEK